MRAQIYICFCLYACMTGYGYAQAPTFLPLQKHKVQWANAVLKNALRTKDTIQLAEGYYLYGKIYHASGNYLKAKDFFMRSLRIQEKRGDTEELARLYYWFSVLGVEQHNYTEVYKYSHLGMNLAKKINSERWVSQMYGIMYALYETDWRMITHHHSLKLPPPNPDSALYYLRIQEPYVRRSNDPLSLIAFLANTGEHMIKQQNPQSLEYMKEALTVSQTNKEIFQEGVISAKLGTFYAIFNMPDSSLFYIRRSEQIQATLPANATNSTQDRIHLTNAYHEYYRAKGNWQKAYEYREQLLGIERQQWLADREGALSRLSMEYETEQKELQIKNQQRELKLNQKAQQTQRHFLIALSALLLGAIGVSVAFYRLSQHNHLLSLQNATLVREQNHRVKNNLQLVSSLLSLQSNRLEDDAAKSAVEDSQRRIEVMSLLQRQLYDGQYLAQVSFGEFIRLIVEMSLQAFNSPAKVSYHILPSLILSADHAMRVGLIINELVTNACKYAFLAHPDPHLSIEADIQNGTFEMQIADNGPGLPTPIPNSFGFRLIEMQVQQLYGTHHFINQSGMVFILKFRTNSTHLS